MAEMITPLDDILRKSCLWNILIWIQAIMYFGIACSTCCYLRCYLQRGWGWPFVNWCKYIRMMCLQSSEESDFNPLRNTSFVGYVFTKLKQTGKCLTKNIFIVTCTCPGHWHKTITITDILSIFLNEKYAIRVFFP